MNPSLADRTEALYIARNWGLSKDPVKYAKRRKITRGSLVDLYAEALSKTSGNCIAHHDRKADELLCQSTGWQTINADRDARIAELHARIG